MNNRTDDNEKSPNSSVGILHAAAAEAGEAVGGEIAAPILTAVHEPIPRLPAVVTGLPVPIQVAASPSPRERFLLPAFVAVSGLVLAGLLSRPYRS